jgi:uncharacterized membrane protein
VFAIAITLLVLNLRVPHVSGPHVDRRLLDGLGHDGGLLIGFVISFYVIARFWLVHHRLSVLLRRVDTTFIVLNLVFLAAIVFLPFPTEIIGQYGNTTTGVVFYAAAFVVTAGLSAATWEYALRVGLVDPRVPPSTRRHARVRAAVPILIFGISIPVAFADPSIAKLCWIGLVAQRQVAARVAGGSDPG